MTNMLILMFSVFIVEPVAEWTIHFFIHVLFDPQREHARHHDDVSDGKKTPFTCAVLAMLLPACCVAPELIYVTGMVARFEIGHYMIHAYPEFFSQYASHHREHHRCDVSNYGITAIWPDILFSTWREEYTGVSEYDIARCIYNWRETIPIRRRTIRWAL